MSEWTKSYIMTAPTAHADALAQLGVMLDPDTGGAETFGITLTSDGNVPGLLNTPHLASVFPCTKAIHAKMVSMNLYLLGQLSLDELASDTQALVQDIGVQAMVADLKWWRCTRDVNGDVVRVLEAKKIGITYGVIGDVITPSGCWQSLGLQRYEAID